MLVILMKMPSSTPDENSLRDKRLHFRGRAKVPLDHLRYHGTSAHQEVDEKHVAHLINVFKAEGCVRLHNPDHYVPVLVSNEDLSAALAQSGLRRLDLMQDGEPHYLEFPADANVTVLHGEHRLRAAERYLDPADCWWVAVLYMTGVPETTIRSIREEYSHQLSFTDGEIYRNIRYYDSQGNTPYRNIWVARLSKKKAYYVRQLDRDEHRPLREAFDRLLPFVGLWDDLELGWLGRILPLRCLPEFENYLQHIYATYAYILEHPERFALFDGNTVKLLETLTPEALHDARLIDQMIGQRRLFPALDDPSIRDGINLRIKQLRGRIPSFFTFFKDAKYLEAIVLSLRPLLPPTQDGPFREAFFRRFTNRYQGGIKVQTGDQAFQFYRAKPEECKLLAYFTLFLAAMRDFPTLSQITPRQSPGHKKPQIEDSRDKCLRQLAILASDLGFASNEINRLITADPDLTSAKAYLLHHCPPGQYKIDEQKLETAARNVVESMQHFATRRTERFVPEFSSQLNKIPKRLRCGIPDNNSFRTTRNCLFLPIICHYDPVTRSHLTSLAIQRDIFVCFFGTPSLREPFVANSVSSSDDGVNDHVNFGPIVYPDNAYESAYSGLRNFSHPLYSATPTSSNYGTRTSLETSSHRISNFQAYVQDIEAALGSRYQPSQSPESLTEGPSVGGLEEPPLAPGFEQSTGSSMNVYHSLRQGISPSVAITEFLGTEHSLILVFLWNEKKYIKFLKTDQGQFEDSVSSLADERFCFMTIEDSNICFHELSDLWAISQEAKLVFASTKMNMAHYTADDSQIAFFNYLDSQLLETPIQ